MRAYQGSIILLLILKNKKKLSIFMESHLNVKIKNLLIRRSE